MATRKSKSDFQKLLQRELQDPEILKGYEAEKKRLAKQRARSSQNSSGKKAA